MEGEQRFRDVGDFGDVEGGRGSVTDGNDGARVEGGSRDEIVMWCGRGFGGAEWASVDDGALERASRTFLFHLVGCGR